VFFSTSEKGQAEGYGDVVVKMNVPIEQIQIDDTFGNEAHVRIPTKKANQKISVAKFSPQLTKAEETKPAPKAPETKPAEEKPITVTEKKANTSFESMIDFETDGGILEIGKRPNALRYSILNLKVDENKRRQGIATRLLKDALDRTQGQLSGMAGNDGSVEMNYKLGMRAFDDNGKELSLAETKDKRAKNAGESILMMLPENKRGDNYKPFSKQKVEEAPKTEAKPVSTTPQEGATVEIPAQRAEFGTRKMVFKEGEWKQNVGGDILKVGPSVQQQAQEAFAGKEETKPAETKKETAPKEEGKKPAPKEEKVTPKLKDYKIKPPSDNVSEVAQSSGLTAGKKNTTKPISELSGGVDLKQEKERRRVDKLKEEITSEGGYISRLIVNKDGEVIEGQHRLEALRELGFTEVPVVELLGPDDFISDVIGLRKAIEDAGLKSVTSQNELVDNITEILVDEKGDVSQLEFYEAPRGYEKPWFAAVKFLTQQQKTQAAPSFTSSQSSEAATAFDKAKTSKGFDKKYGKGAYKALSDITKNFDAIMDKVSDKIKQDCL